MTRDEQIIQASDKWTYQKPPQYSELVHKTRKVMCAYQVGFIDGAVWADTHPGWVSVEDELPPKEENVLIWSSGSKEAMIGYYIGRNWQRKTNDFYSYVDDGYWHNVTHWMPLPALPKKGGEQ